MFAFCTRPVLYLLLFLLPANSSFAVVYYVNINNPTPGAGTSWATAYNDLSAAMAVAGSVDEIWVAQGIYKPTTTTNRAATFTLNPFSIYGGFNGTETVLTQRDPKTYITILSGDIGVAGDASDNSYHVVTLQAGRGYDKYFDGFTIRDGNANAGYPGSTSPQPDNSGGGVLELSITGASNFFNMTNCVITNNFAVYGGGFCAYGDGASGHSFYRISSMMFDNNTAVTGGAIASVSLNGGWGNPNITNCIFTNNSSSAAQGSVFARLLNNASFAQTSEMAICTLYNNGAPAIYNQQTGSFNSIINMVNDIIWKSGAPYVDPLMVGPNFSITRCDLNVVTPPGGSFNVDPLFVNAAGNDFHLTPCSPVIDKGWPGYNIDFEGNARPQGAAVDIGAYESSGTGVPAAAPTALSPTYCENATATALTATGSNLLWYTASTGGTGSSTAPVPSTTSAGTTTWYVTQTPAGGCESARTPVTVTINNASVAPTASSPTYCQNATATALTATGSNLIWYTAATGGTGSSTAPVPATASAGTTTWYVTQTPAGGCESARTPVTVTVNNQPAAPATAPVNYCQNATAVALTSTGSNLLWYTTATGGSGTATAPTPSTTAAGTITYYVSQTSGCESPRAAIAVTVGSQPAAPTAASPTYCQNDAAVALTATGTNLLWYTSATGGTGATVAPTPSTTAAGTVTWYVSQTSSCESNRTVITVTINANPAASFTETPACAGAASTISAITTTTSPDSYTWDFGNPASVSGSGAGPYQVVWNTGGDHAVTLTAIIGTCQNKTTHNVTVYALPQVSVSPLTAQHCAGSSVTLNATGASIYQWSPATGLSDAAISNPVAMLKSDILYTVTGADNNGCTNTAQISLKPINCQVNNTGYNIPDAFTPNSDGHNDLFRVQTADAPQSFRMMIFNRYGGKVFESRDVRTGWNGTLGGNPANTGTYVYTIVIKTSAGTTIEKKGTVMLIR